MRQIMSTYVENGTILYELEPDVHIKGHHNSKKLRTFFIKWTMWVFRMAQNEKKKLQGEEK